MKSVSEMSNSEIDTELALKRGWEKGLYGDTGIQCYFILSENPSMVMPVDVWHPTSSLDQCHEIEEEKIVHNYGRTENRPGRICDWYFVNLENLVKPLATRGGITMGNDLNLLIVHATARQKAEALLMTLREVEG